MFVRNAMTSDVHVCHAEDSLRKITEMMCVRDCGAIPVVDKNQRPIGIITDRDVAKYVASADCKLSDINASELIVGQKIAQCRDDADIENALHMMESRKIRRLLVTNNSGKLVGILTLGDIAALTDVPELHGDHINPKTTLAFLKSVSSHHPSPVISHPN
jgi:predicted transcriptional regulator